MEEEEVPDSEHYGSSKSIMIQNLSSRALYLQTMFKLVEIIYYHINKKHNVKKMFLNWKAESMKHQKDIYAE